jgi:hypothetical protein
MSGQDSNSASHEYELRIQGSHFLDNQLTYGGKAVSLLPPRKIPGTHFCYRPSRPQGHSVAGRLGQLKNPMTSSVI